MALVQDEYGNWYDDGVYDTDYGDVVTGGGGIDYNNIGDQQGTDDSGAGWTDYNNLNDQQGTDDSGAGGGDSSSDADAAAGLIPTEELKALTGGKTYEEFMAGAMTPEARQAVQDLIKSYGTGAWAVAKRLFTKPDGTLNLPAIGAVGGGLAGFLGAFNPENKKVGYQGGIPSLIAQRTMATAPVAGYRPGAGGTNYGGDVTYGAPGTAAPAAPVQTLQPKTTADVNPWAGKMKRPFEPASMQPATTGTTNTANTTASNVMTPDQLLAAQKAGNITHAAQGGIMGLAHGGRYLQGETDGMADKLHTSIDGKQPAALSHGEFVVPADVVSHLGNGNSDAGAKKLYSMMDKIRMARTGTKKQGKEINPDKFMPGGLAQAYAAGGSVSKFDAGGITNVPAGVTGVDQTLASWTGSTIPNMIGKTEALTSAPYQQYTGPLTAGESNLQQQAFAGASENAQAGYTPTQFTTGTFNTTAANQYMNPYLQAALNPQIEEARRQSQIDQQLSAANAIKSGAFGGGASDVMARAANRDLGSKLAGIVGTGYNTAYNNAMQQFNAEQNRSLDAQRATEASRQYGADYGIKSLNQLADLGATQRGIEAEGIAADKKAFEEARDNPYNQLKFEKSMFEGLPIQATNYTTALPSTAQQTLAGAGGVAGLLGNKTNYTLDDVNTALRSLGFNV